MKFDPISLNNSIIYDAMALCLNLQDTERVKRIRGITPWKAFLREYCTVEISLPRQTGHTTNGIDNMITWCEHPVVIVPNTKLLKHVKDIHRKLTNNTKGSPKFVFGLAGSVPIGPNTDGIMIDLSSFVSKPKLDKIYDSIPTTNKTFIILKLQ